MSAKVAGLSQVAKSLYNLECCARCVLRFIGFRDSATYAKPYQDVVQYVNKEFDRIPSATIQDVVCVTCLGLLQQHSEIHLVEQVCSSVKTSSYEYCNFTLAVFVPLVLSFRHHSMWIYLKENFSSVYSKEINFENILSVKDVLKFVYGPRVEKQLDSKFHYKSSFRIALTVTHNEATKELDFLLKTQKKLKCHPRKKQKLLDNEPAITSAKVSNCVETLKTSDEFRKVGNCPPKIVNSSCEITKVECSHSSVFLTGRYNKYSRTVSQSPWIVDGQRMTEHSVQELVSDEIKKRFHANEVKFSCAGREDVDVRMLGKGRPFILELINPRKVMMSPDQLRELQNEVNQSTDDIRIRDLQMIRREDCSKLKDAEESKTKTYSALIYVPEGVSEKEIKSLDNLKDVKLMQKTPLRVLHRRPLAVRQRSILSMSTDFIDKNHFRLRLCTEAGTYIKEFVHGDFGRTQPNLGSIMEKETDILELDVESVDVDWPPTGENEEFAM